MHVKICNMHRKYEALEEFIPRNHPERCANRHLICAATVKNATSVEPNILHPHPKMWQKLLNILDDRIEFSWAKFSVEYYFDIVKKNTTSHFYQKTLSLWRSCWGKVLPVKLPLCTIQNYRIFEKRRSRCGLAALIGPVPNWWIYELLMFPRNFHVPLIQLTGTGNWPLEDWREFLPIAQLSNYRKRN